MLADIGYLFVKSPVGHNAALSFTICGKGKLTPPVDWKRAPPPKKGLFAYWADPTGKWKCIFRPLQVTCEKKSKNHARFFRGANEREDRPLFRSLPKKDLPYTTKPQKMRKRAKKGRKSGKGRLRTCNKGKFAKIKPAFFFFCLHFARSLTVGCT